MLYNSSFGQNRIRALLHFSTTSGTCRPKSELQKKLKISKFNISAVYEPIKFWFSYKCLEFNSLQLFFWFESNLSTFTYLYY